MTELTQNNTRALLPLHYFQAMQLRFEGYKYHEIAKKVDLSEFTLRHLFCKGGVLYEIYQDYCIKEADIRRNEARDTMSAHIDDVARRLVQIVNTGKEIPAIMAGKEILDRIEGKTKETIEHSGTVGIAVVDVLKAIKEAQDEIRHQNNSQSTE